MTQIRMWKRMLEFLIKSALNSHERLNCRINKFFIARDSSHKRKALQKFSFIPNKLLWKGIQRKGGDKYESGAGVCSIDKY